MSVVTAARRKFYAKSNPNGKEKVVLFGIPNTSPHVAKLVLPVPQRAFWVPIV
jgi:hypothetical protein